MVFLALKALVGHVESRGESRSHAWQPRVRSMAHGEEGLGSLLVGGRSSTEAKTRDDARGINGHEQTETFVPSQAVGPSNVCASGQPSFAPTLGIPDGHSRAVQGLVGASLRLHHLCQMQAYLLDETHSVAHQPVELRALGQGGEGIAQLGLGIAVEVPLAPKACPSGEDGEGGDLAGAQGCIWSGVMFLQSGLAEVVDYNVECGEEGVHVDHESTVPFLSGNGIGKPTLMGGHLPLNFRSSNSHQTFKEAAFEATGGLPYGPLVGALRERVDRERAPAANQRRDRGQSAALRGGRGARGGSGRTQADCVIRGRHAMGGRRDVRPPALRFEEVGGGKGARAAGNGRADRDAGVADPAYSEAGGLLPRSAHETRGPRAPNRKGNRAALAVAGVPGARGGRGGDCPPRALWRVAP